MKKTPTNPILATYASAAKKIGLKYDFGGSKFSRLSDLDVHSAHRSRYPDNNSTWVPWYAAMDTHRAVASLKHALSMAEQHTSAYLPYDVVTLKSMIDEIETKSLFARLVIDMSALTHAIHREIARHPMNAPTAMEMTELLKTIESIGLRTAVTHDVQHDFVLASDPTTPASVLAGILDAHLGNFGSDPSSREIVLATVRNENSDPVRLLDIVCPALGSDNVDLLDEIASGMSFKLALWANPAMLEPLQASTLTIIARAATKYDLAASEDLCAAIASTFPGVFTMAKKALLRAGKLPKEELLACLREAPTNVASAIETEADLKIALEASESMSPDHKSYVQSILARKMETSQKMNFAKSVLGKK